MFGVCVFFDICLLYQVIIYYHAKTNMLTEEEQIICFPTKVFFKNALNCCILKQGYWVNHITKYWPSCAVSHYQLTTIF